jgi:small-conductance mechanosensitive channel
MRRKLFNIPLRRWSRAGKHFITRIYLRVGRSRVIALIALLILWTMMALMVLVNAELEERAGRGTPNDIIKGAVLVFPIGVMMTWTVMRGFRIQRLKQQKKAGRCLTCGYDLRESPDRCPECGTSAALLPPTRI